jgi:quercetin dioxygenase-like cupin family protein
MEHMTIQRMDHVGIVVDDLAAPTESADRLMSEEVPFALVDVASLIDTVRGQRILWTHTSADLNVNIVALRPGEEIGDHTNNAVDVLLVVLRGQGTISVQSQNSAVQTGQALIISKGAPRSIRASAEEFVYLTCHVKRPGLWPQPPTPSAFTP